MILESTQLLCTALNKHGFTTPYKSTHVKHPCVLWVEESYDNFLWLAELAVELHREYRYRFAGRKEHGSMAVLESILGMPFPSCGLTPFAQAMPDRYKVADDAVTAYRQFYVGEKLHFARWTRRELPPWVKDRV